MPRDPPAISFNRLANPVHYIRTTVGIGAPCRMQPIDSQDELKGI